MSSNKRLKSITQSIAHHAVSGLSYVHPHISKACEELGVSSIVIELLSDPPYPIEFEGNTPLKLSLESLKEKFSEILEREDFSFNDLASAKIQFWFYHQSHNKDHYRSDCKATLTSINGKVYEAAVNYIGKTLHSQTKST